MHQLASSSSSAAGIAPGIAAAPLLMRSDELKLIHAQKLIMSGDDDSDFSVFVDDALLFRDFDCDACAPPVFDLPPPPRPPWLEEACDDDAAEFSPQQHDISLLESCDNTVILDNMSYFEDTFHSVAVIVVCSIVFVLAALVAGVVLFRRRKSLLYYYQQHSGACHPGSDPSSSSDMQQQQRRMSLQLQQQQLQQEQELYYQQLQDSMKRSSALRRAANHYIPDGEKRHFASTVGRRHFDNNGRLFSLQQANSSSTVCRSLGVLSERPQRTLMELTDSPPSSNPHNGQEYPHIIIGGQPFYLIPSSTANNFHNDGNSSYAYPQSVPIYEEIDPAAVEEDEVSSAASDQGEIGSLTRPDDPDRAVISTTPRSLRHLQSQQRQQPSQRPVTSHSQTTNSSDLSSSGESRLSPPNARQQQQMPRVLVNPLVRDLAYQDTSFSSETEASKLGPRQSMVKLNPQRSPGNSSTSQGSSTSTSSSVYYYSDTLRKKGVENNTEPVDTKIVLDEGFCSKKKRSMDSTQV